MPVRFLNCRPGDALGYPAYYRATYRRRWLSSTAELRAVIRHDVLEPMASSRLAVPLNGEDEPILDGAETAVVDLATVSSGGLALVSDLAAELDVAPLGGWWPFAAVEFASLERIQLDAVGADARANAAATTGGEVSPIEHAAHVVVVVVVIVAIAWGLSSVAKLQRG